MPNIILRENWWHLAAPLAAIRNASGIYEWRIGDHGIYVGKASRLHKRIREYPNNVRRMLHGLPYHGASRSDFRLIHRELRQAHDSGDKAIVDVLEFCPAELLNARERYWIELRRSEEIAGGPRLLNAPSRLTVHLVGKG